MHLSSITDNRIENKMVNVWIALLCVALVGGSGGLLHSIILSDAPMTAKKEESQLKVGSSMVSVTLRPTSMLREVIAGAASGLIFYGSTIAPATSLALHAQAPLALGSLVGIALIGLGGTDYLNKAIKDRQWTKLDPAYEDSSPEMKRSIKRGVTNPVIAMRAMAATQPQA